MRELFPDFWVPGNDVCGWMEKLPLVDGVPAYSYDQVVQATKACSGSLGLAVDVGAHVGLWTIRLAKAFKRVVAIEPIPSNFECLTKNVSKFDNVELLPIAVSNVDGTVGMRDCRGGRSIGWRVDFNDPDISVDCHRLDSICCISGRDEAHEIPRSSRPWETSEYSTVDLLKVDVDGHDYEALLGAERILRLNRPVVVIEEKSDPNEKCTKFLIGLGMRCIQSWKNDRLFVWK